MNLLTIIFLFILLAAVVLGVIAALKSFNMEEVEEKLPYRLKRFFFTKSEQQFFRILMEQIDHTRFAVFPKVRLGDFVETTAHGEERQGSWNRIRSKHVDFLIWDIQNSKMAIAIEVDGSSHNSERMQKSDEFKDKLYPSIKLELVRVRVGSDFATEIQSILQKLAL